jgi:hypothetical protein
VVHQGCTDCLKLGREFVRGPEHCGDRDWRCSTRIGSRCSQRYRHCLASTVGDGELRKAARGLCSDERILVPDKREKR